MKFCSLIVPELSGARHAMQQPGCVGSRDIRHIYMMLFRQVCFETVRSSVLFLNKFFTAADMHYLNFNTANTKVKNVVNYIPENSL